MKDIMVPDKRDSLLLFLLCGYVNDHAAFFFFRDVWLCAGERNFKQQNIKWSIIKYRCLQQL